MDDLMSMPIGEHDWSETDIDNHHASILRAFPAIAQALLIAVEALDIEARILRMRLEDSPGARAEGSQVMTLERIEEALSLIRSL